MERRVATRLSAFALVALAGAHAPAAGQTLTWPQRLAAPEGTIDIYQPQFDTLKGNVVTGRAAAARDRGTAREANRPNLARSQPSATPQPVRR